MTDTEQFEITAGPHLAASDNLRTVIDAQVTERLTGIAKILLGFFFGIVLTWTFTTLWDLNSKIHTVIGQELIRNEIQELLETKIETLEKENKYLLKRIEESRKKGDPK